MLAYVFWHQPAPGVPSREYEQELLAFHERLRGAEVPGLLDSYSLRVDALPWLPTPGGFEDWYLLRDFAALGVLNERAVDAGMRPAHDRIAHHTGTGAGGLYELVRGQPSPREGWATWFAKPPGVDYQQFYDTLPLDAPGQAGGQAALWRRQLALGPALEFRSTGPEPAALPERLDAVVQQIRPLT